ncbi:MAG TPA: PAS domain S-box protein [Alcaligenes sp.]|nr:PAS domain S-box protein [Alcaligenes sp.]HRL27936.1 PAS domain S-box protein [Alcaligenes sp.]
MNRPPHPDGPAASLAQAPHPLNPYVPMLAIVVIVLLMGVFAWAVLSERRDEQSDELIRNALWVEQSLSFQLRSHENNLNRIADELSMSDRLGDTREAQTLLQHFKTIHPDLLKVVIQDRFGTTLLVRPPGADTRIAAHVATPRKATWLPVYRSREHQESVLDLVVPVYENNELAGTLRATFSLHKILTENVPWWIAEHYHVTLVDNSDTVLATRSKGEPDSQALRHAMSVDPPLHGLRLLITPYQQKRIPTFTLLLTVIVGLALLAVVNLVIQHHYARKRRDAEYALLQEQAFRSAIENSMITGMRARDLDGRILYVNPAFCRLVGMDSEQIIGLAPPMPWWVPEMMDETLERRDRLQRTPTVQVFETRFQHTDGSRLDVQVFESPLIDAQGEQVGWIGSIIDISSRKQAEALASSQSEQLHHTAKLITMGEMASTLAHELNQPLSAIASYAAGALNLLRAGKADPALLTRSMESLAEQTRRAGLIIHRIHDFVRKRDPQLIPLNLVDALHGALALARADLTRHDIQLRLPPHPTTLPVLGDKVLLEQVIFNLVRNAAEAMSDLPAPRRVLEVTMLKREATVLIMVADQGPGVSSNIMSEVFQAFTTTKTDGLGIGLNICRSIVELHHGQLWFENEAPYGATFLFSLPLNEHD